MWNKGWLMTLLSLPHYGSRNAMGSARETPLLKAQPIKRGDRPRYVARGQMPNHPFGEAPFPFGESEPVSA